MFCYGQYGCGWCFFVKKFLNGGDLFDFFGQCGWIVYIWNKKQEIEKSVYGGVKMWYLVSSFLVYELLNVC